MTVEPTTASVNGTKKWWRNLLIFLSILGPGVITANVDNDAGGIATYSIAGAHYGYAFVWVVAPIILLLVIVQEMNARMGAVTGKGLSDLIREQFGVKVTFYVMCALFVTNLTNTMAEFAGVAAAASIFGISKYAIVPASALFVWWLVVKGTYRSVEKVFLIACLFYVSYIISGFLAEPIWKDIGLAAVQPKITFDPPYLYMLIGLIGTTIAPWMQFYMQSSVVEKGMGMEKYHHIKWDVWIGCIMAGLVVFFIILACGTVLYPAGIEVKTAADAALALKPLAGEYCSWLFAFGLFNASLFAASVLPLATAYYICEGLGFETGVNKTFREAPQFYGLYTALIVLGALTVLIPNFPLFFIMLFSQVLNGVLLPVILICMLLLINKKEIMGADVNTRLGNVIGWGTSLILIALTAVMLFGSLPLFADESVKVMRLTSTDVTRIVLEQNLSVQQAKLDTEIAKYKISESKSVFDTELTLDASHRVDESARTSTFFGNRTDTTLWNFGLAREFATGTELGVDFMNSRQETFGAALISGTPVVPSGPLYEPTVEFSLTQPIVKNSFGSNDRKGVQAARLAFQAADFSTQRRLHELLFQALVDFWNDVAAEENVRAAEQSVASAKRFLQITERKMKLGTAEETDLLAARAILLRREADVQRANVERERAAEQLRNDLALTPETTFKVAGTFDAHPEIRGFSEHMVAEALTTRPDYAAVKHNLEEQKVKLTMAKNSRWPELDVVSTLALNEIDASYSDAVGGMNHTNWMVGMSMRVPLENRGKRAEARIAEAERARAVLQLKQLEIAIANEVARTTENVRQQKAILEGLRKAEALEQKKLMQELAKYETGRSTASTIERYEDDLVAARRRAIDARRDYATATLEWNLALGKIEGNL